MKDNKGKVTMANNLEFKGILKMNGITYKDLAEKTGYKVSTIKNMMCYPLSEYHMLIFKKAAKEIVSSREKIIW